MRHGKKNNHLGRKVAHRKLMLANIACSLIEHKRINTTVAKAKALRQYIEPILTKSKQDTTHNRRIVFKKLRNKYAVTELFREISSKIADRPGGYLRIIKLGNRLGDNADMAMIELVDYNDIYTSESSKKTTRRSRSRKSSSDKVILAQSSESSKVEESINKRGSEKPKTATKPKAIAKPSTKTKPSVKPKVAPVKSKTATKPKAIAKPSTKTKPSVKPKVAPVKSKTAPANPKTVIFKKEDKKEE